MTHARPPGGPGSSRSAGQGLVEFALVLPVLLIIIVATIDVGRLFFAYVTLQNAAKEGALFGAVQPACTDDRCPDPNNVKWHVTEDLSGLEVDPIHDILITCNGAAVSASCVSGDSYEVSVSYSFALLTPLAAEAMGSALSLRATASALVMNDAGAVSAPALGVSKTSTTTLVTAEGQVVPYVYTIYNTGSVLLTGIHVVDGTLGTVTGCPTNLAVGAFGTCSATYTVDATDMDEPNLSNLVTVTSNEAPTATTVLSIPVDTSQSCVAPTVSFTATPTTGSGDHLDVTFEGYSSGTPVNWYWDFGDGTGLHASAPSQTSPYRVTYRYVRGSEHGTLHFNPTLTVTTGSAATCSTTAAAPSNNYITLNP